MEIATQTECWVQNPGYSTDSNQPACSCCYILRKTHFLECSRRQGKSHYKCKTCDVEFRNEDELTDHEREKHSQVWKQEQRQKIPKVLLEDDDNNDDDGDDDQGIESFEPLSELYHEKTEESRQDENSFANQFTENLAYFNATGSSGDQRNESTRDLFADNLVINQEDDSPKLSVSAAPPVVPEPEVLDPIYECDICCSFFTNYDVYMKHVEKHKEGETLGEEQDQDDRCRRQLRLDVERAGGGSTTVSVRQMW